MRLRVALPVLVLALATALGFLLPAAPSEAQSQARASRAVVENQPAGTAVGAPVTLADPNGAVTHTLGGADADAFSIVAASGQLRTAAPLDHERRGRYEVVVTAEDDDGPTPITVTITVTDVEEPGVVSAAPTPASAGSVIRARLADPDGGVEYATVLWYWSVSADGLRFSEVSFGLGERSAYTPTNADVGKYLKVRASYTDGRGSNRKSAEWVSSAVVAAAAAARPQLTVRTILSGLTIPWDLAFTPDGAMLITERGGALRARLPDGRVRGVSADFSDLFTGGEAGLMGIAVDPDFATNRRFYTCQAHSGPEVQVIAWTIDAAYGTATRVADPLIGGMPSHASRRIHNGCRLGFGPGGHLWVTTGDGATTGVAQDLTSLGGKVLRVVASSGAAASGNPFSTRVYSYGHRNPQGLAFRPGTSQVWVVEHGPDWDDEINLLVAGGNYGWNPGPGYDERVPMTDLLTYPAAVEAKWSSAYPTIAASGAVFLDGAGWGVWNGRLAVASLKDASLRVFEFDAAGALLSETLAPELDGTHGRLRSPVLGPDGALYITTSNGRGRDRILQVFGPSTPRLDGSRAVSYGEHGTAAVATFTAHNLGSSVTWSLAGQDASVFSITGGVLSFRTAPAFASPADANADNVYHLAVEASGGADTARIALTVTVTPHNPNTPPAFAGTSATRTVSESAAVGASVGARVAAADPDAGDTLTYRIVGGHALFSVDARTGQLRVAAALDHETASSHALTLDVSDGVDAGGNPDPAIDDVIAVTITVSDIDEPPQISGAASYTIAENSATDVGSYSASDPEGTAVTWLSLAGRDARFFAFDSDTGELSFKETPDYDRATNGNHGPEYRVSVRASDAGKRVGILPVTITLTNVDEGPRISGPDEVTRSEVVNPTPSQVVTVGTYAKLDPEGAATNWGPVGGSAVLGGTDGDAFVFDQANGRLSFASPPDYEDGSRYEVTLTANDAALDGTLDVVVIITNLDEAGSLGFDRRTPVIGAAITATLADPDGVASATWQWQRSTSRSSGWTDISGAAASSYTPAAGDRGYYLRVTASYTDGHGPDKTARRVTEFAVANDRATNTAPAFPDTVADISIPENSRPGRTAGPPVRATDAERDSLMYSLSGADEFVINTATGQIRVAPGAAFDYEQETSYALTVSADDGFGGTDSVAVTVLITDVNEPPEAADDAPAPFDEDTSATIDVLANDSDPEHGDLTVTSLTQPARGSVTLEQDGTIRYTPRADYHGADSFTYRARDPGGLTSGVATVALTIAAVNDAPAFASATALRTVSERAAAGDHVGAPVTASDADDGDTLSYGLSGAGASAFEIDADSGQITVRAGTAFEVATQETYAVSVEASDGGATASIAVTITVTSRPASPPFVISGGGGGGGGGGPSGPSPSEADFEWTVRHDLERLDPGQDSPSGLWSDGATLWLLENGAGAGDAVFAYDRGSGERSPEKEFELDERNRAPRGIWAGPETFWVSDSGRDRLFAYDRESGGRVPGRDLVLAARNRDARGIWFGGGVMWVLDGGADALFAYDLKAGALLGEYALDDANSDPRGLFSDGVSVWVSDHGAKRLFAYRLPAPPDAAEAPDERDRRLERVRDEEFEEPGRIGNNSPRGIWASGDLMYIADEHDDRVYTYNMPDAIDARLANLSLSGVGIGEFEPGRGEYEGIIAGGAGETVVTAEALQRVADVAIDPPDADETADGHQVALEGIEAITVTVTSPDGSRTRRYRVSLPDLAWDPARDAWPACLRGAVAEGFRLVVYEGGGVEQLAACAARYRITALYVLHEGAYVSYVPGAPEFVNRPFRELFPDDLPPLTPLVVSSSGPPAGDPFGGFPGGEDALRPWPECLRGAVAEGFSLVVYEGGGVEQLAACARERNITALYVLDGGEWRSHVPGAPEFVNRPFRALFADGVPPLTPLVARSDAPAAGAPRADARE